MIMAVNKYEYMVKWMVFHALNGLNIRNGSYLETVILLRKKGTVKKMFGIYLSSDRNWKHKGSVMLLECLVFEK